MSSLTSVRRTARERFEHALFQVRDGLGLRADEAYTCLGDFLDGRLPSNELADLLDAMALKGETTQEYVGFARAMLDRAIDPGLSGVDLDICGTGGSGLPKFNVSTAAAFVLAAGGVRVAKQSSRGSAGRGSFDLLLELGLDVNVGLAAVPFVRTGLCFLEVSSLHPTACRLACAIRASLARQPGIFRYFLPLANPSAPAAQLIGTSNAAVAVTLAEAAIQLGRRRAIVISGPGGLDELSPLGSNLVVIAGPDGVRTLSVSSQDLGVPSHRAFPEAPSPHLSRGDLFLRVLSGRAPEALIDLVLVNSAAGFWCADRVGSLAEGYAAGRRVLESGEAIQCLHTYRRAKDGFDGLEW